MSMVDHMSTFEDHYRRIHDRLKTSSTSSHVNLASFLEDNTSRAHFFLMTLPDSMSNVVDNLQTKTSVTYTDVTTAVLDLYSSYDMKDNKALNVKAKGGNSMMPYMG